MSLAGSPTCAAPFPPRSGARSCPPIKFYRAESCEEELALSARAFLEDDLEVQPTPDGGSQLACTKLLDWYGRDFGEAPRARVEKLRTLLPEASPLHSALGELLSLSGEPHLEFRPYDWGSNEA